MKKFVIGSLLFFLLLLTIFHNSFASSYILTWCPVKQIDNNYLWYQICIEQTEPTNNYCSVNLITTSLTNFSFTLTNDTVWIRIRAVTYINLNSSNFSYIKSQYSNPVQIINEVTPPIINCGC